MSAIQSLIEQDREKNPDCSYSHNQSTSCELVNGKMECSKAFEIFRNCQDKKPVLIAKGKEITQENSDVWESNTGMWQDDFNHEHVRGIPSLFQMIEDMERMFHVPFFGMQDESPHREHPHRDPPHRDPPHRDARRRLFPPKDNSRDGYIPSFESDDVRKL